MNRILGIDYGQRRIGLAISDPLNIIAKPMTFLDTKDDIDIINHLQKIIKDKKITKLVVGLPLNMKGKDSAQTKLTRDFADLLKSKINLPIYFQDERLSSITAKKILIQQDKSPSRNKGFIDEIAAAVFLQEYLDTNK